MDMWCALMGVLLAGVASGSWWQEYDGINGKRIFKEKEQEMKTMVGVINDMAFALLPYQYSTTGNTAFSPYGVTSVLVLLYEGATNGTRRELHQLLALPRDRYVTRLGMRYINRVLRRRLIHDDYLSGLVLSVDPASIPGFYKDQYRHVLRLYGYSATHVTDVCVNGDGTDADNATETTTTTAADNDDDNGTSTTDTPGGGITDTPPPTGTSTSSTDAGTTTTTMNPIAKRQTRQADYPKGVTTGSDERDRGKRFIPQGGGTNVVHPHAPFQKTVNVSGHEYSMQYFLVQAKELVLVPTTSYLSFLRYAYIPGLAAYVVDLPQADFRYRLLLLLPSDVNLLGQLLHSLRAHTLDGILSSLRTSRVSAVFPRFTLEGKVSLGLALQKMALTEMFAQETSDLRGMTDEKGVYVVDIEQDISVSVGSASSVPNRHTSKLSHIKVEPFIANHPFVFLIIDEETSVCLVAGVVNDPLDNTIH